MDTKITMKDRVLEHLQKYGTITSLEANRKYGCSRLSHYIWLLRHKYGYSIESVNKVVKNRFGDTGTISIYTLIRNGEKKDEK